MDGQITWEGLHEYLEMLLPVKPIGRGSCKGLLRVSFCGNMISKRNAIREDCEILTGEPTVKLLQVGARSVFILAGKVNIPASIR